MLLQVLVVSLCIITAFAENWASPFRASNFFIGLMKDNTLIGWGYPIVSSHTSTFEAMPSVVNDVQFVYSTNQAVAAVKSDGSVVCFGAKFDGGICAANLNNVIYIAATANSFAAMKQDGTVIAWGGNSANAGSYNPIPSLSQLSGVGNIYSNYYCMFALKGDGSMLGWGEDDCVNVPASGVKNVEEVYTNKLSTFVIKSDDSYQGWGLSVASGSTPPTTGLSMANYIQVESNTGSFCVIQASTDVVCWGSNYISESVNTPLIVPTGLTKGVMVEEFFKKLLSFRAGLVPAFAFVAGDEDSDDCMFDVFYELLNNSQNASVQTIRGFTVSVGKRPGTSATLYANDVNHIEKVLTSLANIHAEENDSH